MLLLVVLFIISDFCSEAGGGVRGHRWCRSELGCFHPGLSSSRHVTLLFTVMLLARSAGGFGVLGDGMKGKQRDRAASQPQGSERCF